MRVYCLFIHHNGEGAYLTSIWSSVEKARNAAACISPDVETSIETWDVDGEEEA